MKYRPGLLSFGLVIRAWSPDGKHIISIRQNEKGLNGIFIHDIVPGIVTAATRCAPAGFDSDWVTASLGLSPDGKPLELSESECAFNLVIADGAPGLDLKGRTR